LDTLTSIGQPPVSAPSEFAVYVLRDTEPIRGELFGRERLETHAKQLAAAIGVSKTVNKVLLRRFADNRRTLISAHRLLADAYGKKERLGQDAEWLLDNFHIISDAFAEIRTDLPAGYYNLLPKAAQGALRGYPRVYVLALELIAHTDSSLDESHLFHFVQAFQSVAPLTIGELWAIPIMLRLVLIDNLRRLAEQITFARHHRQEARDWARLHFPQVSIPADAPEPRASQTRAVSVPAGRLPRSCSDAFVICVLELLHDHELEASFGPEWVEHLVQERGLNIADILRREQQRQAANQVSIGNCVTSLRVISVLDWTKFFESVSQVERILRADPAGVYPNQESATRDRYRQVIEKLGRRSRLTESEVAARAISLSRAQGMDGRPRNHIGFYLIDQGRRELERAIGYRPSCTDRAYQIAYGFPESIYFGSIGLVTLLLLCLLGFYVHDSVGFFWLLVIILISAVPASELAIGLIHKTITSWLPPRTLPKMDFLKGIPPDCATFVVMPCLLTGAKSAVTLVERLEIHYLSNADPQLRFALLTDFADAAAEHLADDAVILAKVEAGIKALNLRYCGEGPERFFVFHRRRVWNAAENCWMGWERKRGKLLEFNRLLRGAVDTTFIIRAPITIFPAVNDSTQGHGANGAAPGPPARIRFVITLDADTQLPREAAQRMIASLAHPLNEPHLDSAKTRVAHGYGVLQPRVGMSLRGAAKSVFARVFTGAAGLDPYATAVSDVYQDLFGSGSFTGKGIYDVDAFGAVTAAVFPENRVLSHDLIEGNYARCGLVTDIELLDDFPATYPVYARREHRWTRGDWQIGRWLLPRVPVAGGMTRPNPLPLLERWKILDNLRRSLLSLALIALLIVGWLVLPGPPWLWTGLAIGVLAFPLLLEWAVIPVRLAQQLWRRPAPPLLPDSSGSTTARILFHIVFLADQARHQADAIARALLRMHVTKRHLLEWETAAVTERRQGSGFGDMVRFLWPTLVLALVALGAVVWLRPAGLGAASPFLLAWLVAPLVAYWSGRTRVTEEAALTELESRYLHRLARKTWSFFEAYVGAEDHWLPPDNYQEAPKGQVAHRTSPTNIGLYLLSCLCAHDFGYLSLAALLERLERTFATLARLERSHGHFMNWYDTTTLRPLEPAYLSTVDSGNLLGCLLALKHGLYEKANEKRPGPTVCAGLADTMVLLDEAFQELDPPGAAAQVPAFEATRRTLAEITQFCKNMGPNPCREKLSQLHQASAQLVGQVRELAALIEETPDDLSRWAGLFHELVSNRLDELSSQETDAGALRTRCQRLADQADDFADAMDFRILYNKDRHLFAVGYNLAHERLDTAHYDLLASEACLTSFLAVARSEAPKKHWFHLGRPCTKIAGQVGLLSWGGTMFEYLMPRLLLPCLPETLLAASQRAAVAGQREYGRRRGVPWGVSESAFSAVDADLNYQYQAFGVPGLGLKRGLANDLVIAPYAALLALTVCPRYAVQNLKRLANEGAEGAFGFYESLDYTPDRLPRGKRVVIVQCFMAHHQGMSFLAMANCLHNNALVRRFHAEPVVRATELLLQERVPQEIPLLPINAQDGVYAAAPPAMLGLVSRRLTTPHTAQPRTHLLSSGQYNAMITNAGSGWSTCRGVDVTRWREDRTRDCWGQFLYVRDLHDGAVWCAGYQPMGLEPEAYEVIFSVDKADLRRRDRGVETHLEVTVSPESHAEVRRLTLANHTSETRFFEITSYTEVVLGPHSADLAHPAFSKLFLETEFVPTLAALVCQRRPRAADQAPLWAVQVAAIEGGTLDDLQFETDRDAFLGRGRDPASPAALDPGVRLSGKAGAVLDPIFSLRWRLQVTPGSSVSVALTTAVADSRAHALGLADQFHDFHAVIRAFELAWAHCQLELRHLHITAQEAHQYQRLAGHIIYAGPSLRAAPAVLRANRQGQSGLWRHGISGDRPIVLVRLDQTDHLALARELLAAHAYLRLKGLKFDLVLLNEHEAGYIEDLHQQLQSLVRGSRERGLVDQPGGIFLRRASLLTQEDKILLQAAARCIFVGQRGNLISHLDRAERSPAPIPVGLAVKAKKRPPSGSAQELGRREAPSPAGLSFFNGFGGFSADGREYVILAAKNKPTPAPWVNVIANPKFGFLVSESGLGSTWSGNSQSNRLTPWSNDPVTDPPGAIVYLRDEATGEFWSATPRPVGEHAPWTIRHGQGYTVFEHERERLRHETLVMVAPADPVKLIVLKVRNLGAKARNLSATFFAEWVLGTVRDQAPMQVVTELDKETEALLARNPFNAGFPSAVAFADVNARPRLVTADRTEFVGRNGTLAAPAMLKHSGWVQSVGAGLDPCVGLQHAFTLQSGEEKEVVFLLGQGANVEECRRLVRSYAKAGQATATLKAVQEHWDNLLNVVQVRTPSPALDILLNRWLLYQVLSCRLWGRTAFYQSSGAYGFRDQLQDVLALVHADPAAARSHLLLAASRQFLEGDVQHWWNVPNNEGIRTRFSDDFLWLPYAVCHYVTATGDNDVLKEEVPFLHAPALTPNQEDDYRVPDITEERKPLYEHCVRAVDHGLRLGQHGLPLMGGGDWNDGMNRVGNHGKGESVWTAWFLLKILRDFGPVSRQRGDRERADRYDDEAKRLSQSIDNEAWDGQWYRRAYFDDGTPLGSAQNEECKIDSLPQSWAVLAGPSDHERAAAAMSAVEEWLVREKDRLILLFTPSFNASRLEPGYIKGYVPGIRENGGQYTHAALWVVQATALLGKGTRAMELLKLLNPIQHASTQALAERYRVEPYVLAGDVYGPPFHTGRGGWTWYTGSAAWFYRVALETLLGFQRRGDQLIIDPCLPAFWPQAEITYRYGGASYHVLIANPKGLERGLRQITLDGVPQGDGHIPLRDDGHLHEVRVELGSTSPGHSNYLPLPKCAP
jgi:cyclic beta-1,2-glucan synthetase